MEIIDSAELAVSQSPEIDNHQPSSSGITITPWFFMDFGDPTKAFMIMKRLLLCPAFVWVPEIQINVIIISSQAF